VPWVRIDDSFFSHPKVVEAGAEASGLYVWALAYSSRHLTDGHVSPAWVAQVMGKRAARVAEALVTAGLWEVNGSGWVIHDYLTYNPTKAQVEDKRRKDSERKSRA
jgi:hypothetical protein